MAFVDGRTVSFMDRFKTILTTLIYTVIEDLDQQNLSGLRYYMCSHFVKYDLTDLCLNVNKNAHQTPDDASICKRSTEQHRQHQSTRPPWNSFSFSSS